MSSGGIDDDAVAQNIVAIFHASFHPTKGNIIDWSLKSYPSVTLDGVEFSVLPSGLHLVEQDVVYFSHGAHTGLAVFRRRPTRASAHRGFRLASLGVLLEEAPRPRPWLHVKALRELADRIYREAEKREVEQDGDEDLLGLGTTAAAPGDLTDADFAPARDWFEEREPTGKESVDLWSGWSDELDGNYASSGTPTHHLPHLLRILGLSSLTLYKFVLSRRRILIYTLPPVEVAGVLAWIASDLCREHHMAPRNYLLGTPLPSLFSSPNKGNEDGPPPESPSVLGMVTLSDLQRLECESATGRGWIACTTDAIFLEKPQYYDLIVDLTTSTPSKTSRPALYMSKPVSTSTIGKKKACYKLESVRFTWSDVKLWTELDRILKLDSSQTAAHAHAGGCCLPKSSSGAAGIGGSGNFSQGAWADAFGLYEDVCLLCATLWMGLGTWRSNSQQSFSTGAGTGAGSGGSRRRTSAWGAVNAPGDDDWSLEGTHMRTLGQGIEGGQSPSKKKDKGKETDTAKIRPLGLGIEGRPSARAHTRKASALSAMKVAPSQTTYREVADRDAEDAGDMVSQEDAEELRKQNVQTTLALLQTFHANTVFWLSKLREVIPPPSSVSSPGIGAVRPSGRIPSEGRNLDEAEEETLIITARDLLSLELGVLSELDAKFVEWLAEAEGYAVASSSATSPAPSYTRFDAPRRRIVVKRGWQELFGILFGLK